MFPLEDSDSETSSSVLIISSDTSPIPDSPKPDPSSLHHLTVKKSIQTYHLWASSDDDWGVRWDGTNIEALNKHKQFYRVGIRPDWRLLQWDGYVIQERYKNRFIEKITKAHISNCVKIGMRCELKFTTNKLKVGDHVKICNVRKKEYEGMSGFLVEDLVDEFKWRMHVTATNNIKRIPYSNVVKINPEPAENTREGVVYDDEQDTEYFVLTDDGWICSLPLSSANAKLFDDWFLPFLDEELNWDESEMFGKLISSFFK